jgi:hypothetical protein
MFFRGTEQPRCCACGKTWPHRKPDIAAPWPAQSLLRAVAEVSGRAEEFSTDHPTFLHSSQQANGNMTPRAEISPAPTGKRLER